VRTGEESNAYGSTTKDTAREKAGASLIRKGTIPEKREWKTKWKVVIYVESEGCSYKETKTKKNQE